MIYIPVVTLKKIREIQLKFKIALKIILISISILVLANIVYAPWSTLGTGYAITSNYHGIDVPPGTPITVTAATLDPNVVQITFRWHRPPDGNGPVAREVAVPVVTSPYPPPNVPQEVIDYVNSTTIWYAQDTWAPDELGDWGVQAFFQDSTGKDRAGLKNVISIKATSFNTIPEIPLGTIAATAAMIFALGFFMVKKKKTVRTSFNP